MNLAGVFLFPKDSYGQARSGVADGPVATLSVTGLTTIYQGGPAKGIATC
jgi:hypothetical protein